MPPRAALIRSALCLTTAKPRPTPTLFCFPGLSSTPWHDTQSFDWIPRLEANRDVITNEFLALQAQRHRSAQTSDYNASSNEHRLHAGQWDWLSYVAQGRRQADFAEQCPATVRVLESIPGFMATVPFAYAFFSILKPGSSIKAHSAPCNIRLRCHFPLIVPDGCGIRVGDETRQWEAGKALVFDDAYDHEVWHRGSDGDRVVLLFDVWHPELVQGEREAVVRMFEDAKEKGWLKEFES